MPGYIMSIYYGNNNNSSIIKKPSYKLGFLLVCISYVMQN